MTDDYRYGPFEADDPSENVPAYARSIEEPRRRHAAHRAEIVEYFTNRLKRLAIVKTTATQRGQLIDWIPIDSQESRGQVASPPPTSETDERRLISQNEELIRSPLRLLSFR